MIGNPHSEEQRGIMPWAFEHIFQVINSNQDQKKYLVWCCFIEIYMEEIWDLLGDDAK